MTIKGWCPTLFRPMQSGDGWLVRVAPRHATLSAADAGVVAEAAGRYGNGIIDLTNRGNLQIRGLTPASAERFADAMVAAGLAGGGHGPALLVSPLAGADPGVAPETIAIAAALEAAFAGAADLAVLPDKFLLAVNGGGLEEIRADISVHAKGGRWVIRLDGDTLGAVCDAADIPGAVLRLARGFLALAGTERRMRGLVRSVGADRVFQAAGLVPASVALERLGCLTPAEIIGFQAYGPDISCFGGCFGLGIPFGGMDAERLKALAGLADRFGDGRLRVTPWRSVLLTGVAAAEAEALRRAASGWIIEAGDPRRRISACAGAPRCSSATVDARADAALLAVVLAAVRFAGHLHVSGCAKGCAHPMPADVTLVGADGAYHLVRDGRAGDPPDRTGLTLAEAAGILKGTP